jgi:hypothetical protein
MGEWIEAELEDAAPPTTITSRSFGGKGICIERGAGSRDDHYIFSKR